jgi:hypothetical protein
VCWGDVVCSNNITHYQSDSSAIQCDTLWRRYVQHVCIFISASGLANREVHGVTRHCDIAGLVMLQGLSTTGLRDIIYIYSADHPRHIERLQSLKKFARSYVASMRCPYLFANYLPHARSWCRWAVAGHRDKLYREMLGGNGPPAKAIHSNMGRVILHYYVLTTYSHTTTTGSAAHSHNRWVC